MKSPFRSDLLAGKRILVTGGGTGLGKEISLGFAGHGAHVYICGRREQVLAEACAEIREKTGGKADYRITNVRDADSVDQLQIARLKKRKLRLRDQITMLEDHLIPDIIA